MRADYLRIVSPLSAIAFTAINEDWVTRVPRKVQDKEVPANASSAELRAQAKQNRAKRSLGGSGVNVMAGIAKYGFRTGVVGKVGRDDGARFLLGELERLGVSYLGPQPVNGIESGVWYGIESTLSDGGWSGTVNPGANDRIKRGDVPQKAMKEARVVHLSSFACKGGVYDSLSTEAWLAETASKNGKLVSVSGGALYASMAHDSTAAPMVRRILRNADYWFGNETEICTLMDRAKGKSNYVGAAEGAMKKYGITTVVVTRGEKGAQVFEGDARVMVPAKRLDGEVYKVGAGDAFVAGFLVGVLDNRDVTTCAEWGIKNAAMKLKRPGTVNYAPDRDILRALKGRN